MPLALTLSKGKSVRIGDDVRVILVKIRDGQRACLAIEAPPHIPIHREEVYQQIHKDKEAGNAE